jgi:hypothetical protein
MRPTLNITSFSMIQAASDSGNAAALVFFLFDLLYLDGEDLCVRPLIERKARLAALLSDARSPLHYCDHQIGHGRAFHEKACAMLCRPGRRRHQAGGTGAAVAPPAAARHRQDAARGAAAARQPLRVAAGAQPRALGAARARRRSQISHMDGRQPAAVSGL